MIEGPRYGGSVDWSLLDRSFNGQDPIEIWPRNSPRNVPFSRIRINRFYGRFGNNFFQVMHAILIALRLGIPRLTVPSLDFADPRQAPDLRVALEVYNPEQAYFKELTGVFYAPYGFEEVIGEFSNFELLHMVETVSRLFYKDILSPMVDASARTLVLHFRSGDVFDGDPVPTWYVQPPAAFYIKSLAHALEHSEFAKIELVYEDRANPAIAVVESYLNNKGILFDARQESLVNDLLKMTAAHTLVFSFSSFVEIAAIISRNLRQAYAFRTFNSQSDFEPFLQTRIVDLLTEKSVRLFMVSDMTVEYIAAKTWSRHGWQLQMIENFDIEKLRVFRYVNRDPLLPAREFHHCK